MNVEDKILNEWSSANGNTMDDDYSGAVTTKQPSNQELSLQRTTNWQEDAEIADHYNLIQIMEELTAGRNTNRTEAIVKTLVQHVVK
jgi:hypothetical protein